MRKLVTTLFILFAISSCSKKEVYNGKGKLIGLSHKSADVAAFAKDDDSENTDQHNRAYGTEIKENERLCNATKDCTSIAIRCSGHCGGGVNIKILNKYQKMIKE